MSENIFEQERQAVIGLAQKVLADAENRGGGLTDVDRRLFDSLMSKADELKTQATKRNAAMPGGDVSPGESRGESRLIKPSESMRDYYTQRGLIKGEDRDITNGGFLRAMLGLPGASIAEKRALGEGTDAAGGVTVPVILSSMWIDALRAQAVAVKAGAMTLDLHTETTNIAKLTADPTAYWLAENTGPTESDPTFAKVAMVAKTVAVLVTFSVQIFEDGQNFSLMLTNSVTKALALALDKAAFYGTGASNQPTGIVNVGSGLGSYSMGTNGAVLANFDPFVEAIYTMRAANVYSGPSAAVMHPRTNKEANELKTTYGDYLRRPDVIRDLPFLVTTAFPITEAQGTSSTASSAVVGDFRNLIIGMRSNIRLQILQERYMDQLQYGLIAFVRADVAVQHPEAFVRIQGIN